MKGRKPSLRWRIRRWIAVKLFGDPPQPWEPQTEWGRMRRAERKALVLEVEQLRAALAATKEPNDG